MPIHTSWTGEKEDILRDLYLNMEYRQDIISDIFNIDVRVLRRKLKEMNILRSRSEDTKLSWKHGTKIYKYGCIPSRENSPLWKGGRHHDSKGYILIYVGNGGRYNNIYDYEHVIVWEKINGKKLPNNYMIHHINGIRDDNRPENLLAIPRKIHISRFPNTYIRTLQERIRKLEKGA